jgi:hypothetical protein
MIGFMKLHELKAALNAAPDKLPRFVLPDGDSVPGHFHITEVGYVMKRFVDCGGTVREVASCVLQAWVATDETHRLNARKLGSILHLAERVLPHDDLDVELEYEDCVISQYPIADAELVGEHLMFSLTGRHADCLAKEVCGVEAASCCAGNDCY